MARTQIETAFAHCLGRIGEEVIAPKLLEKMGVTGLRNLNHWRMNYEWADYVGQLNGEWVAIAVRTRLNWPKPQKGVAPRMKGGFKGAGRRKAEVAVRRIRANFGLHDAVKVRLLWLAIAIDIDNTYEAYWGCYEEMRPTGNGENHLEIRMKPADRIKYTHEKRRLAWREPVNIPWKEFPGAWACEAPAHYMMLPSISDRDRRVEAAIRKVMPPANAMWARVDSAGKSDLVRQTAVTDPIRPEQDLPSSSCVPTEGRSRLRGFPVECSTRRRNRPSSVRANATEQWQRIERLLDSCENPAEKKFFLNQLKQGRPTTDCGLSFWVGGRSRWCADIRKPWASVVQKGRFAGDEDFWRGCLSSPRSVHTKRSGSFLVFHLVEAADFECFQDVTDREAPTINWQRVDIA